MASLASHKSQFSLEKRSFIDGLLLNTAHTGLAPFHGKLFRVVADN